MPPVSLGDKTRYDWHETLGDDDNDVLLVIRDNLKHMPSAKIVSLALYHAHIMCRAAEGMESVSTSYEIWLHDWSLANYVICIEQLELRKDWSSKTKIDQQMQEKYPQLWKGK